MGMIEWQSPANAFEYLSAHEPVWHVIDSADKEIPGFQYIFDIYKDSQLVTRIKNTPYGANSLGVLDVSSIVRTFLNNATLPELITDEFEDPAQLGADVFFTDYEVQYGQATGIAEVSGNVLSGSYRVYNYYNRSLFDKQNSFLTLNLDFNTNRPNIKYYGDHIVVIPYLLGGEKLFQYYLNDDTVYVQNYVSADQGLSVINNIAFTPVNNSKKLRLSGSGEFPVFAEIYFEKKCTKYETHTLVFLNAFGGYESMTFVHGKQMMTNEKKKFQQFNYKLSSFQDITFAMLQTQGFGSSIYLEGNKTYASKYKEKMTLTSDILSTDEYNWLSELINSPQVYYVKYGVDDYMYLPVQITDNDYELKDDRINKADTLSVTIEFGIPQYTQFR